MKINIKKAILPLLAVPALALSVAGVFAPTANAADDLTLSGGANTAKGSDQVSCLFGTTAEGCEGNTGIFRTIVNVVLFLIGAISVIMLVIGGIKYTVSNGDSNAVTSAKNTIMYAIVGLIIAILAFAVVNFVIANLAATES